MNTSTFAMPVLLLVAACASAPPPKAETASTSAESASASDTAARPDVAVARRHFVEHVKYPATRSEILAACANTKEFTPSEKLWFEANLPEGSYNSPDQVIASLKL
jgi:hypothetical protein